MDEDKPKIEPPSADATVLQQSYPSPTADASDPHFFNVNPPRDGMEQLSEQTEHNLPLALASLAAHQEQQDRENDHDFRELQALQFAQSAAEQHAHREGLDGHAHAGQEHRVHHHQSDAADELRLAAQLSQDLAAAHQGQRQGSPQDHMPEQRQDASQPPPEEQQLQVEAAHAQAQAAMDQGRVDPDLQRHLQAELQNHDQQLRGALAGAEARPPPPPHYTPTASATPHLPPLPSLELHPQFHMQDSTPPRKRSKVSRACDECRRKKIKCDAQSELVETPCSNCRRANAQCLFSRVPQKRGPSKGYIKELADRINQIEGKLGHSVEAALENASRRSPTDAFPSPIPTDESRKRPFSSISGDGFPTPPPPPRTTAWPGPGEHRPIRPNVSPEQPNTWTANSLFLKPRPPPGFPETEPSPLAPRPEANMLEGMPDALPRMPLQGEPVRAIDDAQFTLYLNTVHPTFPVLANSKERVQALLSGRPAILQDAFCSALSGLALAFSPPTGTGAQENGVSSPSTQQLLNQYESEPSGRSRQNDIVHFQTLVMTAIHSGTLGPLEREHEPDVSTITGKAFGAGVALRLWEVVPDAAPSHGLDVDSDENVAFRAWWALILFNQWNTISRAVPALVGPDTAVIWPGLRYITGEPVRHLARLSRKIALLADLVNIVGPRKPDSLSRSTTLRCLEMAMDSITEHTDDFTDPRHPTLNLAYWHTILLADLFREIVAPGKRLANVVDEVAEMVDLLAAHRHVLSPLTHHFIVLVAVVLAELTRDEITRPKALQLSTALLECSLPLWVPWTGEALGVLARAVAAAREGGANELAATADAPAVAEDAPAGGAAQKQEQNGKPKEHWFNAREVLAGGYLRSVEEASVAGQGQG